MISSWLIVCQCISQSTISSWPIWPMHMHRRMNMSHNLVTEIKYHLTGINTGTGIAFPRDSKGKISSCLLTPPAMKKPCPFHRPNQISSWDLAWDTICRGESVLVQQGLISWTELNRALRQAGEMEWLSLCGIFLNITSYDYCMVEKTLPALAIFRGHYQESPHGHPMFSL